MSVIERLKVWALFGAMAFLILYTAEVVQADGRVRVWKTTTQRGGQHSGHTVAMDEIVVSRGTELPYVFSYIRCTDPSHAKNGSSIAGGLGLKTPGIANWYHQGSIDVIVNGQPIVASLEGRYFTRDLDDRSLISFEWDAKDVFLACDFLVFAARKEVFLNITVRPKMKLNDLKISLLNYPSGHTYANKIAGDRFIVTATGKAAGVKSSVENNKWKCDPTQTIALSIPEDQWVFYSDKVLDPAMNLGLGPSGLFLLPGNIKSGGVEVTGYEVVTSLQMPPEGGSVRMALVDFYKMENSKAQTYMTDESPSIIHVLAKDNSSVMRYIRLDIDKLIPKIMTSISQCQTGQLGTDETMKVAQLKVDLKAITDIMSRSDASTSELNDAAIKAEVLLKEASEMAMKKIAD